MIKSCLCCLAVFLSTLSGVSSHPTFRDNIPNGMNVPHPCKPNYIWAGVGHMNAGGGGARNNFGMDFEKNGLTWSKELCLMDSDKDGKTNGEELGDPNCTWTQGSSPSRTDRITHPGVCDPWESQQCRTLNTWVSCDSAHFECNATKDPDVRNITLQFPKTPVPSSVTTYYCMNFDLPSDQPYHLIADMPSIDNVNVMHHIVLYGCLKGTQLSASTSPYLCGMEAAGLCSSIIGLWSVGYPGECMQDMAGFLLGPSGYTKAVMQFHYNNPYRVTNYTDSSGMTLFYTPKLRNYSAETFMLGQRILEIPPAQPSVPVNANCPSRCTKYYFNQTAYVISAVNHMHYLGTSMHADLYRNDTLVTSITNDEVYSYDSPVAHAHNPPLEIRPGDEFRVTCVFNSMSRKVTTFWGEATQDEMCFTFMAIYPREAITRLDRASCVDFGTIPSCDLSLGTPVDGCNWVRYLNNNDDTIARSESLTSNCNVFGACRPECNAVVQELLKSPCLHGDIWKYIIRHLSNTYDGMLELSRINSCLPAQCPAMTNNTAMTTPTMTQADDPNDAHTVFADITFLCAMMISAFMTIFSLD